ncbi:MAG: SGNH/GDSL hydrolase family protein [Bacteroidales bacterium]|nr:SGNH/GDSL hydrolase family protein [Bacteroidales bacterium]
MFRHYKGIWMLLAVALVGFVAFSFADPLSIGGHELKKSSFADVLAAETESADNESQKTLAPETVKGTDAVVEKKAQAEPDTVPKTILFIGDSMLDGLSPRLAAYAAENGHTLYSVIWYSSSTERWAESAKLTSYINKLHPDYIFICLGSNELMIRDIKKKRDGYVKKIIKEIGDIPFIWIGPPNWREDTGINDLIAGNVPAGSFFLSNGMSFERRKDGAHPTVASAALWMDSVARWMPRHSAHPIRMDKPAQGFKARPKRIFIHQPNER